MIRPFLIFDSKYKTLRQLKLLQQICTQFTAIFHPCVKCAGKRVNPRLGLKNFANLLSERTKAFLHFICVFKIKSQLFGLMMLSFWQVMLVENAKAATVPTTVFNQDGAFLILVLLLVLFSIAGFGVAIFAFYRMKKLSPHLLAVARVHYASEIANYERLLAETEQCALIWQNPQQPPRIVGRISHLAEFDIEPRDFLRFGRWLEENSLRNLDQALNDLRVSAKPFELYLQTRNHILLHVTGVIAGSAAIARFQDITLREAQSARLQNELAHIEQERALLHTLLNRLDEPVCLQNASGQYIFTNQAYQQALGGEMGEMSLFNQAVRDKMAESGDMFQGQAYAVVDGERRSFEVTQIVTEEGRAIFAHDDTKNENLMQDMAHIIRGHAETLDQFSTAVSIFGTDQKLKFYNQSFATLWPLDNGFLESEPSHTLVLDRLRELGIIAEHPDWRGWKDDLFSAYHSGTPSQHIWNLPDGRTLRVVASPHPQGGVTWLYENLTEKIELERRYNTLIKMQGETLDHLSEGVAVFGPDGKVRLSNPALAKLWSLPQTMLVQGTHIANMQKYCAPLIKDDSSDHANEWGYFGAIITGFTEHRDAISGRVNLISDVVLDYALVPLPNGQTMMTFVNVTDTVNITRALEDKNEALESADRLRTEFVQHVSYELRTPLTNIIGFSDMLRTETFGPLNPRQHEYLQHIASESGELLNIVNDILDLATLDAGVMQLDVSNVDIAEAMAYASERTRERLGGRPVQLIEIIDPQLSHLYADAARLRQIFVNVLSNAANFAPDESTIVFRAEKSAQGIVFSVHDDGFGIPDDILQTVFQRFSSHAHHGARAGAGLGLSIVKSFVELHGGTVEIETATGLGTTVICRFPDHLPNQQVLENR